MARSPLCTQTLRVDGTQGLHSVYERWILNAVCAINFNYSMRVLSKIQSSLSELTFMHAGLITARAAFLCGAVHFLWMPRAQITKRLLFLSVRRAMYVILSLILIICVRVWYARWTISLGKVCGALNSRQNPNYEWWGDEFWAAKGYRFLINILY